MLTLPKTFIFMLLSRWLFYDYISEISFAATVVSCPVVVVWLFHFHPTFEWLLPVYAARGVTLIDRYHKSKWLDRRMIQKLLIRQETLWVTNQRPAWSHMDGGKKGRIYMHIQFLVDEEWGEESGCSFQNVKALGGIPIVRQGLMSEGREAVHRAILLPWWGNGVDPVVSGWETPGLLKSRLALWHDTWNVKAHWQLEWANDVNFRIAVTV